MKISLIVAADENNGIGKDNQLLCHLPADLKYFKNLTSGHHIVMGRKTFESIGKSLPNRTNMVLSRNRMEQPGIFVFSDTDQAIQFAADRNEQELFVVGGDSIYKQFLPQANCVYLTRIQHVFDADTFFPVLPQTDWKLTSNEHHLSDKKNAFGFSFQVFERR